MIPDLIDKKIAFYVNKNNLLKWKNNIKNTNEIFSSAEHAKVYFKLHNKELIGTALLFDDWPETNFKGYLFLMDITLRDEGIYNETLVYKYGFQHLEFECCDDWYAIDNINNRY